MGRAAVPNVASATPLLAPVVIILAVQLSIVYVNCLSLKLDRATARTLLIDIVCGSACDGNFTWEYKSSADAVWRKPRMREHYLNPLAHYLTALSFNTQYHVRVWQNPAGIYSQELTAWTCSEHLPGVTGLRVADAGPGWLDIRWTPPQEKCLGRYYYHVRYKAADSNFTRRKTYGYYSKDDSLAAVNPSHPCDPMTKEFCVLLTDKVRAGQRHIVELQAERIGGAENEESEKQNITAFADPGNTGPSDFETCPSGKSWPKNYGGQNSQTEDSGSNPRRSSVGDDKVTLPLWLVTLLGTAFFLILAILLGVWLGLRIRSTGEKKDQKFENLSRTSTVSPAEERYVRPRDMAPIKPTNRFEECDNEAPLYEEVNIHFCGQTVESSAVHYKREQCS